MIEISKELLREVLNIDDIVHIQKEGIRDLFISRANNPAIIINIYELAHKCKEWAHKQGHYTEVRLMYPSYKFRCRIFIKSDDKWDRLIPTSLLPKESDTELNCIFKACQWILDNIKES